MDLESLTAEDKRLSEETLDKATDYVLKLHSHIEDFRARKTIHYESNPAIYEIYNPFFDLTGKLLIYRKLSDKLVLHMIYEKDK